VRGHYAFNRLNPSGHAVRHLGPLLPTRSDVLAALRAADSFAGRHETAVHCTMPIPHCMVDEAEYARVEFGECSAGTEHGEPAIDCEGRLKLCTVQQGTVGSLFESSLAELVAAEAVGRFRRSIPPFCEACPHREGCLGGCGAAAEWVFGRADEVDPFLAQHVMVDFQARVAILEREGGE
jgi:radical SAM protein with 4Fe4S-binding SPASM domain